jgi:8-amino-7-oxononanoate synthase
MKLPERLQNKLDERKEDDSFRSLHVLEQGIDFCSNDYLGMAKINFTSTLADGATGSRLISGDSDIAHELERFAATFYEMPAALLYNSGYAANIGLLSCVPLRGDTILYDELCHASIRDGIRLSNATSFKFRHNDFDHLLSQIKKAEGTIYVVVESVYSMDGDEADLKQLGKICREYGAYLIVDEAHAAGVYGEKGKGASNALGLELEKNIFAKIITFGKAYGSHGAMVLGSLALKDYLINFSRSLIYTTALPPASVDRILFAIQAVAQSDSLRKELQKNITYFRRKAEEKKLSIMESFSPIQGVFIAGNKAVKTKATALVAKGILVKAILSPTVPKGKERIRICIHSFNTQEEIDQLISALT